MNEEEQPWIGLTGHGRGYLRQFELVSLRVDASLNILNELRMLSKMTDTYNISVMKWAQ